MEACELVRLIVNKAVVPAEPKRRGNPRYGQLKAISSSTATPNIMCCGVAGSGLDPSAAQKRQLSQISLENCNQTLTQQTLVKWDMLN